MDVLKTRCPSCQKLYAVDFDDIVVDRPEFECSKCQVHFAFNAADPMILETIPKGEVKSYLVNWREMPEMIDSELMSEIKTGSNSSIVEDLNVDQSELASEFYSPCPKCEFNNPLSANECTKCGILIKKVRQDHPDSFRSTLRVRTLWEKVLENYEDEDRHEMFLSACRDDNSLPYASFRYQSILNADPSEEIALTMRERVKGVTENQLVSQVNLPFSWKYERTKLDRVWFLAFGFTLVMAFFFAFTGSWFKAIGAAACIAGFIWFFRSYLYEEP